MSEIQAILRLTRASIALSAAADSAVGMAIAIAAGASTPSVTTMIVIPLASLALFAFGMAQNDLVDRHKDAAGRGNDRPLPSGALSLKAARTVVFVSALIPLGVALYVRGNVPWLVASMLVSISAYNCAPSHLGPIGPGVLGAIRAQNLLLGATAVGAFSSPPLLGAALLYFVYIAATSVAARMEDGEITPTVGRLKLAIRIVQLVAVVAPIVVFVQLDYPRASIVSPLVALYLVYRIETALRAALRDGIERGPSIPRLIGACLSGILLFDAGLAIGAGCHEVGAAIVLLFPLSRLLVRRFPPS